MAKFSERRCYVLRVIQPSTRSTLGEYDSRPPLARYMWYFTSYLRSSCCSETHVCPRLLPVFLPLSTLDVTHVRKCTRPSPLYSTASDKKLGVGLGMRLVVVASFQGPTRFSILQVTKSCVEPGNETMVVGFQ